MQTDKTSGKTANRPAGSLNKTRKIMAAARIEFATMFRFSVENWIIRH
jgi:hypothetical protein